MPRKDWKPKGSNRRKGYRRFLCAPRKGCGPFRRVNGQIVQKSVSVENTMSEVTAHQTSEENTPFQDFNVSYQPAHGKDTGSPPTPQTACAPSTAVINSSNRYEADCFLGFDVQPLSQGIRVVSLFDGIGAARVALDRAGINVIEYFSSEVDEKAINVLKYHHYNKMRMVGSVKDLTEAKLSSFGAVNLLLGGSPCADLSLCNPARRGLHGENSSGKLFFEYKRILDWLSIAAKRGNYPFYWLFENTFSMELSTRDEISRCLGCQPVVLCAERYVPMKRKRYFWGNIPELHSSKEPTVNVSHLQDYLRPYRTAKIPALPTITGTRHSQLSGKDKKMPANEDGQDGYLLITEQEAIFGFPEHYTDCGLSLTDRRKLIGQSWCIPVVVDILKPLADELHRNGVMQP